jgi:hypothetical protein
MGKIQVNDPIRPRELTTIQGERITIPVPEFRTHLQFHGLLLGAFRSVSEGRQDERKS